MNMNGKSDSRLPGLLIEIGKQKVPPLSTIVFADNPLVLGTDGDGRLPSTYGMKAPASYQVA